MYATEGDQGYLPNFEHYLKNLSRNIFKTRRESLDNSSDSLTPSTNSAQVSILERSRRRLKLKDTLYRIKFYKQESNNIHGRSRGDPTKNLDFVLDPIRLAQKKKDHSVFLINDTTTSPTREGQTTAPSNGKLFWNNLKNY